MRVSFWAFAFVVSLLVLGAVFLLWPSEENASEEEDMARIIVLFETKDELQEGSPVVYKESTIGKVYSIQLGEKPSGPGGYYHVQLDIRPERLSLLYHQMCIVVEGDRRGTYIEFEDSATDAPVPIIKGDKVIGSTRAGCIWEKMRRATGELIGTFAENVKSYGVSVPGWVNDASVSLKNTDRENVEGKIDHLRREAENAGQTLEEVFGDTALLRALLFKFGG